jgi:hypothetical protein
MVLDRRQSGGPSDRGDATKVIVDLEVRELEGRLADGVRYTFWTFGGHVPGKLGHGCSDRAYGEDTA